MDTVLIYVDNAPLPFANAGGTVTICIGDSIQLFGSGGASYQWVPGAGLSDSLISNPLSSPNQSTVYYLTVTNTYCFDQDSALVVVDKCLEDIPDPIPNVITPNNDGSNDFFWIPEIDYFTKNELVIYNRWGNVVYSAKPYKNEWVGKSSNGKDLPDGIYYYVLDLGNGSKAKTGFVLINR